MVKRKTKAGLRPKIRLKAEHRPSGRVTLSWPHVYHPQVKCGKQFTADKTMAPVLRWLNGFDRIHTVWSCQGDGDGTSQPHPYVIFRCDRKEDLIAVVRTFQDITGPHAHVRLNYPDPATGMRYVLEFTSVDDLKQFATVLTTGGLKV